MDVNSLPIMTAIKKRMSWLNNNQKVISENIANADTPEYMAKELKKQDFSSLVESVGAKNNSGVGSLRQAPGAKHEFAPMGGGSDKHTAVESDTEVSPTGNSVVLEEEMIKMADNQMQYNLAINLYRKNIGPNIFAV